jgi:hypothetical protein
MNQYQTVAPPQGIQSQMQAPGAAPGTAGAAAPAADLIVYPKNGQSQEQQGKDRFECHKWAVGQTGFDPTQGAAPPNARRGDYMRAQTACLEGRGYSVK